MWAITAGCQLLARVAVGEAYMLERWRVAAAGARAGRAGAGLLPLTLEGIAVGGLYRGDELAVTGSVGLISPSA